HANVVQILVGKSGFSFDPQNSTASKGDILSFIFVGAQSDVVQSNGPFGLASCNNTTPGGFNYTSTATPPAPSNGTFQPDVFNYTITQDSGQIFFICDFPGRCENGMYGVVTITGGSSSSNGSSPTNGSSSTSPQASNSATNQAKSAASTTHASTFTFAVILFSSMFVSSFMKTFL
ncbi:4575_t:CDS:2, partial [Dentiscutata heterogama]